MFAASHNSISGRLAVKAALFALAVFASAWAAMTLTREYAEIAAIWPINALVLAVLIRVARTQRDALLLVAGAAIAVANLVVGSHWQLAAVFAVANLVEVAVCLWAFAYKAEGVFGPERPRPFFVRLFMGAALGSLASASIASAAVALVTGAPLGNTLVLWGLSDFLGLIVFLPCFWVLGGDFKKALSGERTPREAAVLWAGFAAIAWLAYAQSSIDLRPVAPFIFMLVALGLGAPAVAIAVALCGSAAVVAAALGVGPIAQAETAAAQLFALQWLLALSALIGAPIGAAIAQRQTLLRQLRISNADGEVTKAALSESLRQWDALIGASRDIIVRAGRGGIITYASPACRDILGIAPEAAIGRSTLDFVAAEDRARGEASIADVFSPAGPTPTLRREFRARGADGSVVWLEGSPGPIRNALGETEEFVTVFRDVTHRREAEERLAASREELADIAERWNALAQVSRDMIVRFLPDTTVTYVSPASSATLGYAPEELVGRRIQEFIHPDDLDHAVSDLRDIACGGADGPLMVMRLRGRHKDGGWRWIEGRPRPVIDTKTGAPSAYYDVMRDVTEQVEMERSLEREASLAEAAARAKAEFLANMSHELRTPLNSVIGYARLLAQSGDLVARDRRFAEVVRAASETTLSIVNDVLDAAAIDGGALRLRETTLSVQELLLEAAALVTPQADAKGLRVHIDIDAGIGRLRGDADRLRQIVLNLASNAVKFTAAGRVSLRARLLEDEDAAQIIRIEVADTGPGIAAEHHEAVFERFVQLDEDRSATGSGLGLAIVRDLVALMDGELSLESERGAGSTFRIGLRLAKALPGPMVQPRAPAGSGGARILVVDDVDLNRELIAHLLTPHGHDVTAAGDGPEAVALAAHERFDLILMDVRMPGMDGFAAARAIRAGGASAGSAMLALSATVGAEQTAACIAAGMDGALAKPVDEVELLAAVANWTAALPPGFEAGASAVSAELRARFVQRLQEEDRDLLAAARLPAELTALAHRMAGSAGSFGFPELGVLAAALEEASAGGAGDWELRRRQVLAAVNELLRAEAA